MKKLVELNSINTAYDSEIILKDVNLNIYSDDFIGIIGPNGGGKTTLVKVILKLIKPISGTVKYYNDGAERSGRFIGYLPQLNTIDKKFPISVLDVVLSGLISRKNLMKHNTSGEKKLARDLINKIGISHIENKTIGGREPAVASFVVCDGKLCRSARCLSRNRWQLLATGRHDRERRGGA